MNKEYYNKVYIPDIVKWGKITMLLGIITCFGPALVISVVYGCMPPVSASMLVKADIAKEIIKYTEGIQGAIFASGRRE